MSTKCQFKKCTSSQVVWNSPRCVPILQYHVFVIERIWYICYCRKRAEEEVAKLRHRITTKDEEFTKTADGLERELEAVRDQMKHIQKERDKTLKDKESLLEEVGNEREIKHTIFTHCWKR